MFDLSPYPPTKDTKQDFQIFAFNSLAFVENFKVLHAFIASIGFFEASDSAIYES